MYVLSLMPALASDSVTLLSLPTLSYYALLGPSSRMQGLGSPDIAFEQAVMMCDVPRVKGGWAGETLGQAL